MNGWLRVVRQEVRRLCPLALAMGLVTAALVWTHPSDWGTRWNSLGSYLREVVIVIGPACVVVGVWCGGAARRAGVRELLASTRRSNLARVVVDVVALAVVLYAGVLLGWASGAWTIVVVGGYGTWVAVWYLLGLLPTVAAYTAIGYAVGRLVPWRVAAPVAGLAAYVALGFVVYTDPRIEIAQGMGQLGGTSGQSFATRLLVGSSLGLLALAVVMVAAAGAERRPAATRGWVPVALVSALTALVPFWSISTTSLEHEFDRQARPALACSTGPGPEVCVLAEQRPVLAQASEELRTLIARFGDSPGAPTRGAPEDGTRLEPGTMPLSTTGITPWGRPGGGNYATEVTDPAAYLSLSSYCRSRDRVVDQRLADAASDAGVGIAALWLSRQTLFGDGPDVERRFLAADARQRGQFVGRLAVAAQACDLQGLRAAADVLPALPAS